MKYYIVAGEASGDVHGANLIKAIKEKDSKAQIRAWGGDLMKAQGADLVKHYRDTAYMGIFEVLVNLNKIFANIKFCKQDITDFNPDAVILIDYPGFNFKIADYTHKQGFKTLYYIAPKIWAWKTGRIKRVIRSIDRVFSILPFEKEFYAKYGYTKLDYVGNPILDNIDIFKSKKQESSEEFFTKNGLEKKETVAILCGSRVQEIKNLLPTILKTVKKYKEFQFVVAGLSSVKRSLYEQILEGHGIKIIYDQTYELLSHSKSGIIASGTASLETALFDVPHVVVYKMAGGRLLHRIGQIFIKVKYASLVNLINDKESVKELLQNDFTQARLEQELDLLFYNQSYRQNIYQEYQKLNSRMGEVGASSRAADLMLKEIQK